MRNKSAIAAAILLASTFSAHAQTAYELLNIQSQTAFVRAQIELAKAQNELASARGSSPSASNMPQIVSIERFGKDVVAKLRLPNGAPIEVRPRDRLPDGSLVTQIRANGVLISKAGNMKELAFITGEKSSSNASAATPSIPSYGFK